jgi:hypothetical protein
LFLMHTAIVSKRNSTPSMLRDLCFIGSVSFDDHLTNSSLAVSCSLQSVLALVVQPAYTDKL